MVEVTVTEMDPEMVDTLVGREKMICHESDTLTMLPVVAVDIKRILASCGDIRRMWGGFLEYSVFLPFITRGKPFFDVTHQGSMALRCLA
jgi:hypothetical protein